MKRVLFALLSLTFAIGCGNQDNKAVAPEAVDLGLPSGTLWANFNVGATAPEEYGDYYAWGEIETKSNYSASHTTSDVTIVDFSGDATYDVAAAKWGDGWRTPTKAEFEELIRECEYSIETVNGVTGHKFVGPNGNSIFLPSAGYKYDTELARDGEYTSYWSSTRGSKYGYGTVNRNIDNIEISGSERYYGSPVRPVRNK